MASAPSPEDALVAGAIIGLGSVGLSPCSIADCPLQIPGFVFNKNLDTKLDASMNAPRVAPATPWQLAEACLSHRDAQGRLDCVGFVPDSWQGGLLKVKLAPQRRWQPWKSNPLPADACSGGLWVKACPDSPGFEFLSLLDSAGNDLPQRATGTLEAMLQSCSTRADCVAVNNNGFMKSCLK